MKQADELIDRYHDTLKNLRARFPLYHGSNVFLRDIQYGIQMILRDRGERVSYSAAEKVAHAFVARLEWEKILVPIDGQTWALFYPEFKTPVTKPAPQAKAAPQESQPKTAQAARQVAV
jgi:hypothetical protein